MFLNLFRLGYLMKVQSSMLMITPEIRIPFSEFALSYVRSSGPGGQNVNKVNSKAVLRWNVLLSPSLSIGVRSRLLEKLRVSLTQEGELILMSDRFRDQIRNREDCYEKLKALVAAAAVVPKDRKKTKPTRSAKRKVKDLKTQHSAKKALRGRLRHSD